MGTNINFYRGNSFSTYETGSVYFEEDTHLIKVATSPSEAKSYSGVQSASYTNGILSIVNENCESISLDLSNINNSLRSTPTDIPTIYFGKTLPTSKDQGNLKGDVHIRSKNYNIDCYGTLKVQGNSSTAYNKKNFTITFYEDAECTTKKKINFGWGAQSKYVLKANWIDITHSRNIIGARLWGDVVKSRDDYESIPELLKTSPNYGAVDGFPVKFYGNNVYWGRYTMNIPKDAWMTNMDKTNTQHLILCGENYNEALFRAPARWDGTDWTDELHDEVPADLLARFNELVSFVMNSSDVDFKAGIGNYVDLRSVFDYYVFGLLICNLDGFGKNHIWLSYDGNKFIASAYDMDSTFGLYWDGSQMLSATYARSSYEDMVSGRLGNLLYIRIVNNFTAELQATYSRLVDNNGPQSVTGTTTLDATKVLLDQNYSDTYLMNIAKVTDTFSVSGSWHNSSFSEQTSSISGYRLYSTSGNISSSLFSARTGTVTLTFSGNLPKTIYTKLYISNTNGVAIATVNSSDIVTASTNNTIDSITNFTEYSVTGNTININLNLAKTNTSTNARFYILVPNDETYYTIKSKVGNYGPTGTTGAASWSTDLIRYQISNATSILEPEDITTNINTENNPCMIRFTNPSGSFLNASGSVSALKYATGTGAWSV